MATSEKEASVAEIKERLANSQVAIMSTYKGISVAQVTALRKTLRDAKIEYKVYKNTLATIALRDLGLEQAAEYFDGPTAWAFSDDPVAPAKLLKEVSGRVKFVTMAGGVLNGRVVTKQQLESLASLPSRQQLLGQVVGTINMPLQNLVGVLSAVPRNLVNVLDQVRKQREESAAAA